MESDLRDGHLPPILTSGRKGQAQVTNDNSQSEGQFYKNINNGKILREVNQQDRSPIGKGQLESLTLEEDDSSSADYSERLHLPDISTPFSHRIVMKSVKRRHSANSREDAENSTSDGLHLPIIRGRIGDSHMTSSMNVISDLGNKNLKTGHHRSEPPSQTKIAYGETSNLKSTPVLTKSSMKLSGNGCVTSLSTREHGGTEKSISELANSKLTKSSFTLGYLRGTLATRSKSKINIVAGTKSKPKLKNSEVTKSMVKGEGPSRKLRKNQYTLHFTQGEGIPPEIRDAFKHRSRAQGGLHHFGIGKTGMTRTVVKFSEPPQLHPTALCFHFPSTCLTHRFILDMVKEKIHFVAGGGVTSVMFRDRNVLLGSRGLDNRWVITLSTIEARDELMRLGLYLFKKRVTLRHYDDVLQDEYREFQEYVLLQEKLFGNIMPDDRKEDKVDATSVSNSEQKKIKKTIKAKSDDVPNCQKENGDNNVFVRNIEKENGFPLPQINILHHLSSSKLLDEQVIFDNLSRQDEHS